VSDYFDAYEVIAPVPAGPVCELDGHTYDSFDNERYWHCDQPGTVDVDGVLMCERHAGQLGHGPMQAEFGFDPGDGLNPTAVED
jgi:hypothetical protein